MNKENFSNPALKLALEKALQTSLEYRGVRDRGGRPVVKYAFIRKRHIKRITYYKLLLMDNGKKVHIRIFK